MEKLAIRNKRISQSKPDLRYTIERGYAHALVSARVCICLNAKRQTQFLACVCMSLRACIFVRVLIKTQNAFARKIFQHSNAIWVHKISGCTIYMYIYTHHIHKSTHTHVHTHVSYNVHNLLPIFVQIES